jgi:zinc transporter ZupT
MTAHFMTAFAASALAAAVTTCGIFVIRHFESWGRRNTSYFVSFAAGCLITVAILHLLPKSIEMQPDAPIIALAGYMTMYVLNKYLTAYVCDRPETADLAIGLVPMLGIGLHSFIDGTIYSVTFSVSIFTGAVAAIGMILHEFPEGIVTYILLLRAGFGERKSFALAFFAAALTTPGGMLLSFPFISHLDEPVLGALLALSSGALLYVGATHLLPQAERDADRYSFVAVGTGIIIALGIVGFHP